MSANLQRQHLRFRHTDRANALFLLRNAVNSLTISVNNLVNPVSRISEDARKHLTFDQQVALENSFSLRTVYLKRQLARLRTDLAQPGHKIFANLHRIRSELE